MSALKIKDDQGNWINLPGLKGDKGDKGDKGESGVYLGTTAPSDEDINVWINPNGEAHTEAVVVDPTLTMEGQAADAKATGDVIAKISTNLFNSADYSGIKAYPNGSTKVLLENNNVYSVYVECEPDTIYTVEKDISARFSIADFASEPVANATALDVISDNSASMLTIKTNNSANYLLVFCYHSSYDTSLSDILNSLKISKVLTGSGLIQMPFTYMPVDIVNTMAYKPMASPDKGYMCLVSDDGAEELVTYALPMVITKDVPLTMAVMSSSEVFDSGTLQATVIDAVQNHGCEISQHGGTEWTKYNEMRLRNFIKTETAFFNSLGLTAKSAVIPAHMTTELIKAVMGGTFGVVRSGYRGLDAGGSPGTINDYYDYYTSGENSNLYGLSSFNLSNETSVFNHSAIDYANASHKVIIVYWHENSLTAEKKVIIEDAIDYAKTVGLEFVTLSQLGHLIDLQRTVV